MLIPFQKIDDTLNSLADSKWFITHNLASGYWQVEICQEDREKIAFCTPDGHFEFMQCPSHIPTANGFSIGWSAMVIMLVCLDDVIIMGQSFEESAFCTPDGHF